ncbi:phage tail protein [Weissella cibaria]|uniref:phage tail protein n=1 Tax=Weissella cibaria TaxID=137591 RepID=UPI001FA7B2C0|nr:phage tail protein [Weissella cibaria]UNW40290.1 phage tail protein [Weissella cibaria]
MLKFRDPQSNIQLAEAELTYKEAVNGEKSLTGTIYSNDDVLHQMERGWSVMFNGDWYYITYVAPTDGGNSITVEFDAVHEFFFKMSKSVAYGTLKDGSHTAKEYLDFVFNGSGYSYTLLSQVDAWEKQSFGDKNRLALFNDLISDMEMEFSIADSGRIMITSEIGQDLSTIVRKGFNLQELNLEYNVSDFVTYAKGFGAFIDKDDESKGRYEAEYTSPLASVYGKLEADPITDERYTKTASLQAALKKAVDSSYSISVGISLEELQNAGYDYESPVPGDYILAVDEQLDFNQRIRIISVEEQYNIYGERISSSVEAGSLSATKQKLDGSESNSVVLALSHATELADNAVKTANGKNASYSGPNQPQNPIEGDMWWYDNGSGTSFMKQYTNGEWVILVDSNTKQNIEKAVDSAIETSKTYTDELNEKQVQTTNALNEKVDKSVKALTDSQQAIASQASAYTDSAVADANAKAVQIGQTTAQNAQKALDEAKQDFTNSLASQASQTASMASDVTSKANQYASQAKSEAITAATSADGVVRTEFKKTTDSMTATIQQTKSDADSGISKAQTTATQALDGLSTKVEKTEYNKTTGDLTSKINTTSDTAEKSKQDIADIKVANDKQDNRMLQIEKDATGVKQTVSDLQTVQGKQSGSISKLEQRADGFDATVTKVNNLAVGGRNYILNSSGIGASDSVRPVLKGGASDGLALLSYLDTGVQVSNNQGNKEWFYGLVRAWTDISATPLVAGNTYTISFKVKGTAKQVATRVGIRNTTTSYEVSLVKFADINNSDWTKVSYTFSIPSGINKVFLRLQGAIANSYNTGFVGGETFTMKELKLESGNIATDWTLAPEDLSSATAKAQLTADQATLSINNYKTDADGRISKAQADIKVNADAITQKVSQSDYNTKTGELTTSVNKAQQTADTATQTIGTYKETNDQRVATAETNITANADAIKLTASKTELNEATGKLSGDISTLQQRADGFDATVTKVNNLAVGGRNLLQGTGTASGDVSNGGGTFVKGAFNGYDAVKTNNDFNGRYINLKSALGRTNAKAGDWYTISVYVKADKQIDTGSLDVYRALGNVDADTNDGYLNAIPMRDKPIGTQWQQYAWSFQITNISLQRQSTRVESYNTGDNWIYWAGWKLERGNLATDWTPAPEDIDAQIAQVKITADGVYQTVNNPQTGLNTRVSTAEGNISTIKSNVDGMSNTVTETADGLTREIADRKTGDSNTLQAGKDFTTSQITSYDTGMQSRLTQVSDGIMAQVSATNLITDSSFVNATSNWTLSGDVSWKINNEIMRKGVRVATFDNGSTNFDRKTATLTSTPIYTMNLGGTQFYASFDLYAKSFGASAYFKAEIVQKDSSGSTTKSTPIGGSFDTGMSGWNNYMADITLDSRTTSLYLQFTQYGGGVVSVSRPYLGSTKLPTGAYMPGASNDNSSILKLFNNFFAFGIQSNTGALISGINGDSSGLNIAGKKITITGDTNFIGKNFMDGALIKNASIGTAQIADVSITNAKIASLDVNKISGNVSNFIQSNWNGKYGSTTIDANGMKVDTNGVNTQFGSSGMKLTMAGESVGGIGVQGLTGKPNTYQGLTFWLDGNAEYMAWGARNSGDTSMNPVIQMSWYRSNSAPTGAYAGFNFDDDVIFNKGINVPGVAREKLGFATKQFNGFNYPYFGDSRLKAGFAYGAGSTYLISGDNYYYLSRVIVALSGLGAVKIPSAINSDGTVAKWFNVTL